VSSSAAKVFAPTTSPSQRQMQWHGAVLPTVSQLPGWPGAGLPARNRREGAAADAPEAKLATSMAPRAAVNICRVDIALGHGPGGGRGGLGGHVASELARERRNSLCL